MVSGSDIFVSYASDTKPLAEQLVQALQNKGIRAWADFKDLHPGQRFQDEVNRAVQSAKWLLFLVGPDSRVSASQDAEWRAALAGAWSDSNKKLLPVIVGGQDPPPFLRSWVALRIDPDREPTIWTNRVLDAIRSASYETAHGLAPKDRRERNHRLAELSKAAEQLADSEPEDSIE